MSFGFCVGDIIAACLSVQKVVKALHELRESTNSTNKIQDLVSELHNLNRALLEAEILSQLLESAPELTTLAATTNKVARACTATLEGFLEKFKNSLVGLDSIKARRPQGLIRKIQLRLSLTEEVTKVRGEVNRHCESINFLLATASFQLLARTPRDIENSFQVHTSKQTSTLTNRNSSVLRSFANRIQYFFTLGGEVKALVSRLLTVNVQVFKTIVDIQSRVPRQISFFSEPVVFEDAIGRVFPIPLDLITSWESLEIVLTRKFENTPGAAKVRRGEYSLENRLTGRDVNRALAWESCLIPGQRIDMSVVFNSPHRTTRCPNCQLEVDGERDKSSECSHCKIWFRRIEEVIDDSPSENANEPFENASSPIGSSSLQLQKINDTDGFQCVGKGKRMADGLEEDISSFKRVRLIHQTLRMSKIFDDLNSKFQNIPSAQDSDESGFAAIHFRSTSHPIIESLQLAAYHGDLKLVATMLAEGSMVDELGPDRNDEIPQCTALQAAVYSGHEDIVHLLVASNANINALSPRGGLGTALLAAVTTRNQQLGAFLLIKGADPNMISGNSTPLVEAACRGDVNMVQILLEHGADVNMEVETERPLWAALRSHNNSVSVIVDILLKSGADVNLPYKSGQVTPLQAAAAHGSFGIVKKLIEHGAIINAKGSPHTALCSAAINGDVPTMRLLLDSGAHIQARDRCGKTPLHHAAAGRQKDSNPARILLERGAATNMRDAENWTPLHYAAAMGNQTVVDLLLSMGADSEIEDNLGRKPIAFGSHNKSIVVSSSPHGEPARVLSTPPPEIPCSALVYLEECNSPASVHPPKGESVKDRDYRSSLPSPDRSPSPMVPEDEDISSVLSTDATGSSVSDDTDYEIILFDEVRSIAQNETAEAVNRPNIHSDSPLLSSKREIFDNVFNHFLILFNKYQLDLSKAYSGIVTCTNTPSSTQSHQASTPKPAQNSASGNKRKRVTGSPEDDRNEDESRKRRKGRDSNQALSRPAAGDIIRFSCPYKKRDPHIYITKEWKSCAVSCYESISRLKAHLYRRHRAPIQCRRCGVTFSTQNDLDAHARLREGCIILDPLPYVGFSADIDKALRKRSKWGQQTDVREWNEIYSILFPGEDIPSAYFMNLEAAIAANPRALDAEAEYIAIEVPQLFRERLHAVLILDDRRYADVQGYLDSIPAMLETCIQDARFNFGLSNTLSGHHFGSTASPKITNQLDPHAPYVANHAGQSFMLDSSPSQPTPEPHLHHRSSLYANHTGAGPNVRPFTVTEQASASDSGYMEMTGQWQAEDPGLPGDFFQDFDIRNFDMGVGMSASHFQIGDPAFGGNEGFEFARGEGQEEYHKHQE